MAKARTSGKKQSAETAKTSGTVAPVASEPTNAPKKSVRSNRPQIGGTAVPGAKSTVPKGPPTSNNPQQQQLESYNRTMRRRMQNMGAGEDQQMKTIQNQRRKRLERRKQRIEERRAELRKSIPGGKIVLGRRNLYFIIGVVVVIVLLVLFALLRQWHVLG